MRQSLDIEQVNINIYVQIRSLILSRFIQAAICRHIDQTISHSNLEPSYFGSLDPTPMPGIVVALYSNYAQSYLDSVFFRYVFVNSFTSNILDNVLCDSFVCGDF